MKILKICVLRAEILAQNKADNAKIFNKCKRGGGIWVATSYAVKVIHLQQLEMVDWACGREWKFHNLFELG